MIKIRIAIGFAAFFLAVGRIAGVMPPVSSDSSDASDLSRTPVAMLLPSTPTPEPSKVAAAVVVALCVGSHYLRSAVVRRTGRRHRY